LPAGSPEEATAEWIRQSGVDPRAVGLVLGTLVATAADALQPVSARTLVVVGDRDSRGASAGSLAGLLPHGQLVLVPGDQFTAFGAPEFTAAVLDFLGKSFTGKRIALAGNYTCLPACAGSRGRISGPP
jgi:hypothetical protein